jgi:predicted glycoside hydrolase/deacetylase ChbG (UPF0249 family)
MCTIVDNAIDDCIEAGLLTSTNVVVNMEDLEAAKTLRQRFPNISVGLHWNVTAGKPVCDPATVPSLIDNNTGCFWKVSEFIRRFRSGAIIKEELKKELLAQYNVFHGLCGQPDYWNTHQNSSVDFASNKFFNQTAQSLGIFKTRSQQRVYVNQKYPSSLIKDIIVEVGKRIVLDIWFGYQIRKTGTKMPEGRVLYFDLSEKTRDIKNIGENIKWGKKRIVEMVIHPATSPDYPSFGTITHERVAEWKMFTSHETKKYLESIGIKLVTFDSI